MTDILLIFIATWATLQIGLLVLAMYKYRKTFMLTLNAGKLLDNTLKLINKHELNQKIRHKQSRDVNRKIYNKIKSVESKQKKGNQDLYSQLEALLALRELMGMNVTGLRGWALSPDASLLLYNEIIESKPSVVVEFGGGVSSLVVAVALKKNGKGKLISFDHDEQYAGITKQNIKDKGLSKYVDVRVAKLVSISKKGKWYDPSIVTKIPETDFIIVDGPPEGTNASARQPVIQILKKKISKNVTIFVDDYFRSDEKNAVKVWMKTDLLKKKHYVQEYYTEKGTAIIRALRSK